MAKRSNMQQEYASIPRGGQLRRNLFKIRKRHLTTQHGGILVPIYWNWFYPGEVISGNYQAFLRASAPLEFPLFDSLRLTIHTFFCPLRIVWDNARKFFGERENPADSISYVMPKLGTNAAYDNLNLARPQLLTRYLEIPSRSAAQGGIDTTEIGAAPFRVYETIYDWHYRDANQQDQLDPPTDDGPDNAHTYQCQYRGKRFDRFTAALPAPQKGDAVPVNMPLRSDESPGNDLGIYSDSVSAYRKLDTTGAALHIDAAASSESSNMHVELLIADLRNAVAIQQLLERDNRYGNRYGDVLEAQYGTEFNDIRIAPVYCGGGTGYISSNTIANTNQGSGDLGDLAAIATGVLDGGNFTYAVDEPGILMAIANVSADLSYSQGLHKKHTLNTRYDHYIPALDGIGDQSILTKELYYQNNATDDVVFGYEPRNEHRRTDTPWVSALFDPNDAATLEVMHLQEDLGAAPVLGDTWIKDTTPYARMLQTALGHHFLSDYNINWNVSSPMPRYGIPGLGRL